MPEGGRYGGVGEIQERFRCAAASSFDDEYASALAAEDNVGLFWTSTGLFPQQLRFDCADPELLFAVTGLSADFWLVKEARITVLGAGLQELRTAVITPPAPARGEPLEFASEHLAIPTDEPCRAILVDIVCGFGDFCALHKCRILGKQVRQPTKKLEAAGQPKRTRAHSAPSSRGDSSGAVADAAAEKEAFRASSEVNQGQRRAGTTVVAAVYGDSNNAGRVRGNHTVVVPRGRGAKKSASQRDAKTDY